MKVYQTNCITCELSQQSSKREEGEGREGGRMKRPRAQPLRPSTLQKLETTEKL